MNRASAALVKGLMRIGPQHAALRRRGAAELPMPRLLRLSLFQVTVGMAAVLLIGTLNRVMIVELGVPSWLVALMLSLPLLFAPLRALIGFRSDHASLGARLAARALHLVRHDAAVRRLRDHAVRAADPLRRYDGTDHDRAGGGGARVSSRRRGSAHGADRRPRARDRSRARAQTRPRVVALLCAMLLARHGGKRARLRRAAREFQRHAPHSGRAGRRRRDDGAELRRAVEAGAARRKLSGRVRARRLLGRLEAFRDAPAGRAGGCSRPRSAPPASACRTSCSNPMAGKCCTCRSAQQRRSPRCWRSAAARASTLAARWLDARRGRPSRRRASARSSASSPSSRVIFAAPLRLLDAVRPRRRADRLGGGLVRAWHAHRLDGDCAEPEDRGLALGAWGAAQATAAGLAIAVERRRQRRRARCSRRSGALGEALVEPRDRLRHRLCRSRSFCCFATLVAIGPLVRPQDDSAGARRRTSHLVPTPSLNSGVMQ